MKVLGKKCERYWTRRGVFLLILFPFFTVFFTIGIYKGKRSSPGKGGLPPRRRTSNRVQNKGGKRTRRNCDYRLRCTGLNPPASPAKRRRKVDILHSNPEVSSPVQVPPRSARPGRVENERAVNKYRFFVKLVETRHNYDCSTLTPYEMRNLVVNLGYPEEPATRIAEIANRAVYGEYMPTVEEFEQMTDDIRYFQ